MRTAWLEESEAQTLVHTLCARPEDAAEVNAWLEFNSEPVGGLPDTFWPPEISPEERNAVLQCASARRFLNREILHAWGDPELVPWNPEDPAWRLALLPAPHLVRCLVLAAFCQAAELLRTTIQGRILKPLSDTFGRPYLDYAIHYPSRKRPFPGNASLSAWSADPISDLWKTIRSCAGDCFGASPEATRVRVEQKLRPVLTGSLMEMENSGVSEFVWALASTARDFPDPRIP